MGIFGSDEYKTARMRVAMYEAERKKEYWKDREKLEHVKKDVRELKNKYSKPMKVANTLGSGVKKMSRILNNIRTPKVKKSVARGIFRNDDFAR